MRQLRIEHDPSQIEPACNRIFYRAVSTIGYSKDDDEKNPRLLLADNLPMSRNRSWGIAAKGHERQEGLEGTFVYVVSPGYLRAMGMHLVEGRDISWDDTDKKQEAWPVSKMDELIRINPRNQERIFPFIGGEEINDDPHHQHHRYDDPIDRNQTDNNRAPHDRGTDHHHFSVDAKTVDQLRH